MLKCPQKYFILVILLNNFRTTHSKLMPDNHTALNFHYQMIVDIYYSAIHGGTLELLHFLLLLLN